MLKLATRGRGYRQRQANPVPVIYYGHTDGQQRNRKIPIPQGRREKLIYAKLDRDVS